MDSPLTVRGLISVPFQAKLSSPEISEWMSYMGSNDISQRKPVLPRENIAFPDEGQLSLGAPR